MTGNPLALQLYTVREQLGAGRARVLRAIMDFGYGAAEGSHPYLSGWWPPGHTLGWDHTFTHQARDLLTAIADGTQPRPSFGDGLAVQRVLDAVARSAAADGSWQPVPG